MSRAARVLHALRRHILARKLLVRVFATAMELWEEHYDVDVQ